MFRKPSSTTIRESLIFQVKPEDFSEFEIHEFLEHFHLCFVLLM